MTKDLKLEEEQEKSTLADKDKLITNKINSKPSFTRIITYLFKVCFNMDFILIQIFNVITDSISIYKPFVDGNIVNCITLEANLDNMLYWGKVRVSMLFSEFFLFKLKKRLKLTDDTEEFFGSFRLNFYKKVLKKEMIFHDYFSLSKVQDIYNNDFDGLYAFLPHRILNNIRLVFTLLFNLFVLITISYELFLIQILSFAIELYAANILSSTNWDEYMKLADARNEILSEGLFNIKLLKCFSLEEKILRTYKHYTKLMTKLTNQNAILRMFFSNDSFVYLVTLFKTFYCGKMVLSGHLGLGDFVKFKLIASKINEGGNDLLMFYKDSSNEYKKVQNIFEVMDFNKPEKKGSLIGNLAKLFFPKKKEKIINENVQKDAEFEGHIEFRNVDFRYPTRSKAQIFNQLSFKINSGEVVAFVGASGSGKSTVASLLHKLYDPESGEVLIDNKNIKYVDIHSLRNKIGYVSQEPCLFTLTIKENILLGLNKFDLSPEEEQKIEEKLKIVIKDANCQFVYDKSIFPDGLDTIVSGNNLSGGQKQRIAIARALMKDVNFLVFDEATSALDANSEAEVQKAIDEIIKEARITTIIIAHRLSTIKNCHKIFVLNKGKVVEEGTHKELKKLNGYYKELINKQIEAYEKEDHETLLRKNTSKLV